jgi:phenylacetate-CoA ligase
VVVTGFDNLAMPFIRYHTGDLAVYGGEKNGMVELSAIQGRTQEYIVAADGRRTSLATLLSLRAFENVVRWQIVQDEAGRATVLVVKEEGFSARHGEEIKNHLLQDYGVDATIRLVHSIPRTRAGKTQLLVQNISQPGV